MILHDRRVPGSPANIDHLVIGPTGVFVVDAKNFSHQLSLNKGTLWTGRYPVKLSSTRNEAQRAETALASVLVGRTVEVLPLCAWWALHASHAGQSTSTACVWCQIGRHS